MKNLIHLLVIGSLCIASSAFAGDRLSEIEAASPSASPFEVLKQLYSESTVPAKIEDFDFVTDFQSRQYCVIANRKNATIQRFMVARDNYIVPGVPAIPSNGPLFPGSPGKPSRKKPSLKFGYYLDRDSLNNDLTAKIGKHVFPRNTELDILYTFSSQSTAPLRILIGFRKNGTLISFKFVEKEGGYEDIRYGYCYRE